MKKAVVLGHEQADLSRHAPRAFVGDAELARQLHRGDAVLRRGEQEQRVEPQRQRRRTLVEDRPRARREERAAGTLVGPPAPDGVEGVGLAALRTLGPLGKPEREDEGETGFVVGKLRPECLDGVFHLASLPRKSDKSITERQRCSTRRFAANRRLVSRLSSLIVKAYLMGPAWPLPTQFQWRFVSAVKKPCSLAGLVAISRLPNFANPYSVFEKPRTRYWSRKGEMFPGVTKGRMFYHSTIPFQRIKSRGKTPTIVSRSVMFAAPSSKINMGEASPQLTRRMRHNGVWSRIVPGVPLNVPRIDAWNIEIAPVSLYEQRRDCFHAFSIAGGLYVVKG